MNKINNLETDPDVLKILIPYMISVIAQINVWGQYIQQRALGQMVVMERESGTLLRLESIKDFRGGPVVKSLSANAGDTGSIPGPGRFHRLRGN